MIAPSPFELLVQPWDQSPFKRLQSEILESSFHCWRFSWISEGEMYWLWNGSCKSSKTVYFCHIWYTLMSNIGHCYHSGCWWESSIGKWKWIQRRWSANFFCFTFDFDETFLDCSTHEYYSLTKVSSKSDVKQKSRL